MYGRPSCPPAKNLRLPVASPTLPGTLAVHHVIVSFCLDKCCSETLKIRRYRRLPSHSTIMSDERSVEAHILGLLAFTNDLIDDSAVASDGLDAGTVEYIKTSLRNTVEFSPKREFRHLAGLALAISSRSGSSALDQLALEICTNVHDAISGLSPIPKLQSFTGLLERIEIFSRASYHPGDQVQEYRRRLNGLVDGREDETAQSTSYQMREIHSSARLTRYPPIVRPTPTPYAEVFSESNEQHGVVIINISQLCLFVYHLLLLRLPNTFHSLASSAFFLQNTELCEEELWDNFTDILLKKWKTLGLFSTLIFGATLTMFQIPSVTASSLLRTLTHCALLCVMMSLMHTSLLSLYFGSWKSGGTAVRWVQEMRAADPYTFWNFWVLIALPAVWTCWGIFLFLGCMILFVWPLGEHDPEGTHELGVGARIFLMVVVVIGGVHLALTIATLKRVGRSVHTVEV
ncbi:hypothetical protein C8R46DRAFT_447293 [Mycena filopes]|nr:hypothetical protein C8R46DRAFT_447293 [Mycena filopes]